MINLQNISPINLLIALSIKPQYGSEKFPLSKKDIQFSHISYMPEKLLKQLIITSVYFLVIGYKQFLKYTRFS